MISHIGINLFVGYLVLISWSMDLSAADRNVGCFFSPDLCDFEEDCFDDNAFGRCENQYGIDNDLYRHSLSSDTMQLLEKELTRLFVGGYRWHHDYTQCVVQNILYSKRHKVSYDPGLCSRIMQMTLPEVPPELLPELENSDPDELALIKFTPDRDNKENFIYADENFIPPLSSERNTENSKKAETPLTEKEIIKKRDSENILQENLPGRRQSDQDALSRLIFQVAKDTQSLFDAEDGFASRLPSSQLSAVQIGFSFDSNQQPMFSEGGLDWIPAENHRFKARNEGNLESGGNSNGQDVIEKRSEELDDENNNNIPFTLKVAKTMDHRNIFDSNIKKPVSDENYFSDDSDDSNFQWNMKHYNRMGENIFDNTPRIERKNDRDMARSEQSDYLEDNLHAIFPLDKDFLTFQRPMRYDTKKPGPTYFYHDDEDGVSYEDDSENNGEEHDAILARLMGQSQKNQLRNLFPNSPSIRSKTLPGFTKVQEDERVKELIHIQISPEPTSPLQKESKIPDKNNKSEDDAAPNVKRAYESKSMTHREETFPHKITGFMLPGSHEPNDAVPEQVLENRDDSVDAFLTLKESGASLEDGEKLVKSLEKLLDLPQGTLSNVRVDGNQVTFRVNPNSQGLNASDVAEKADGFAADLNKASQFTVESAGTGDKVKYEVVNKENDRKLFILTFTLCGAVVGISLVLAVIYVIRRHARSKEKLQTISQPDTEASQDYQDLCRQRMASKTSDGSEVVHTAFSPKKMRSLSQGEGQASSSSHSSTSSWNEEPVTSNMDISTGHVILSYMEDHLKKKDRLDREWEAMCAYEAEPCSTAIATLPQNIKKNRYPDVLPYDHSRVVLNELSNVSGSDYINASTITDHDPRNPAYIATQGPLPHTAADFWQMIWEQGSVVMVMLTRLMENGVAMCHRHWPEEGSEVYHIYEVHLVSEHIWCDVYLVRSFYLKNLRTGETRTVTQFHFLSWPDNGVPNSTKALLEFRRKVNKSYRGRSCPIVVHCSDGIGRTGTYILIDMVLNRMAKGAKEIDIAATLEHIRDQRAGMVKTKAQFEFVLMAIAEEVHAILKALSQ